MFARHKLLAALVAAIMLLSLAACGGAAPAAAPTAAPAAEATAAPAPTTAAPAAEATAAPEPSAAAEATAAPATGAEPGTLVMAIAEDSASLDPGRSFETTPSIVHKATYETLVTFPAASVDKIEPLLAKEWKISDDGKTYTFTLRDGAMFSDGSPVTAADVVFSFNRMKNIKGNPSFLAETIDSVSAANDTTVELKLKAPDPAILSKLVFSAFSVVNSKVAQANGATDAADADKSDKAETWFNGNSAGSGPYILTKWEKGVETVLERNPKYTGTAPKIERVIIRNIPEAATQKLQLEAGDVQIAMDLSADQLGSLQNNPDVTIFQTLSDTMFFLLMNQDKTIGGPMSDPKVQQAVRLALDYEGFKALAGGQAVTPPTILPVGFAGAYGEDKALKRDVEAAKKLLADAGQTAPTIDLEYPDFTFGGVSFGTMAQKVQADLAEAGITVNLKPAELQVALENYRQGKEAFGLWLWLPDYRDSLDYVEFLPDGVVGKRANWLGDKAEADVVSLRDKVKVETNVDARNQLFGQMQDYLLSKGPYAALVQPSVQIGLSSKVQNFAYNPQWRVDLAQLGMGE